MTGRGCLHRIVAKKRRKQFAKILADLLSLAISWAIYFKHSTPPPPPTYYHDQPAIHAATATYLSQLFSQTRCG